MDSYFAFGMVDSFACLNIYSYYKRMEAEVKGVGETIKTKGTSLLASRIRTQGGREAGTFRFYLWYVLAGEGRKEWERSMYYLGRG